MSGVPARVGERSAARLPRSVTGYVVLVTGLALSVAALLQSSPLPIDVLPTLAFVGIGLVAGALAVKYPEISARLAPTEPFILAALCLTGPWSAVSVALAAVGGRALCGGMRAQQIVFNSAVAVAAAGAAGLVFGVLGGNEGAASALPLLPLFGAAATFFAMNGCLVAGVIALSEHRALFPTTKAMFLSTLPAHSTAPVLALALLLVLRAGHPWAALVALLAFSTTMMLLRPSTKTDSSAV